MGDRIQAIPASLLLVQRQAATGRALGRLLERYFAKVFVAESPERAELFLSTAGRAPSHLICGQDFGSSSPRGHELIARWRRDFSGIVRAVLATGAEGIPSEMPGVDAVFEKPGPISLLINLLDVRSPGPTVARASIQHTPPYSMEIEMKANTPRAHQVATLKERLSQAPKQGKKDSGLRTAQGFAVT